MFTMLNSFIGERVMIYESYENYDCHTILTWSTAVLIRTLNNPMHDHVSTSPLFYIQLHT